MASQSTEPASFRVRVSKGSYYNEPFMDQSKFTSYSLAPLHRSQTIHGFVENGTELARQLESLLSKELNANRAMILSLAFPNKASYEDIVEIRAIETDSWLR